MVLLAVFRTCLGVFGCAMVLLGAWVRHVLVEEVVGEYIFMYTIYVRGIALGQKRVGRSCWMGARDFGIVCVLCARA